MEAHRIPWFLLRFSTSLPAMTPTTDLPRLDPPQRLLCGPGPSNVEPAVLEAMQKPMLGHLDPDLHEILLELVDFQRRVYNAEGGLVFPHQATGSSGMECGLVNLLEPGDTVIVAVTGFFGNRIARMAERTGAKVVEVHAEYGQIAPNDALLDAIDANPDARLVAVVHAETSTGVRHPVEELGRELKRRGSDTLLIVDCVTSLGGAPGRVRRVGHRLRRLVHAEGARRAARHVADRRLRPRARARRRAQDAGAVHVRPRPAAQVLGRAAGRTTTRRRSSTSTRCTRRSAASSRRASRSASSVTPTPALPPGAVRSRGLGLLADPDYQLAQLTAVSRPRGRRRQGRPGAAAQGRTTSRSAAGSVPTPRPSGGSASWATTRAATWPTRCSRRSTRCSPTPSSSRRRPEPRERAGAGRLRGGHRARRTRGAASPRRRRGAGAARTSCPAVERYAADGPVGWPAGGASPAVCSRVNRGARPPTESARPRNGRPAARPRPPRTPDSVPRSGDGSGWTTGARNSRKPSSACSGSSGYRTATRQHQRMRCRFSPMSRANCAQPLLPLGDAAARRRPQVVEVAALVVRGSAWPGRRRGRRGPANAVRTDGSTSPRPRRRRPARPRRRAHAPARGAPPATRRRP